MVVKTAEIFVFWDCGTPSNATGARMYALPLSSKLLKDHPIIECLGAANIIIVDEATPLPGKQRLGFCSVLVHEDPAVRVAGKIPIISSGFCSNLVAEKLKKDTSVHRLLNIRNKSINKIDGKAVRIISKLLTPGKHFLTLTAEDEDGDEVKDTLLNFSIDRKCFALCETILKTKVNVNEKLCTEIGYYSALTRAIRAGSVEMVQLLLDHGADAKNSSVLCAAAESGHLSVLKFFLERGNEVNGRDSEFRNTALHRARKPEVAKLLLASGARVNAKNKMHQTPLHEAVSFESPEVVRVLLEHNANINALFQTEFEVLCDDSIYGTWPSPKSNAIAVAACLGTKTLFEMLIKFGAASKFEDMLSIPSCQKDLSAKDLFEKLERFFDFTFAGFNDSYLSMAMVPQRLRWTLNTVEDYDICDFLSKKDCDNLKGIADKIAVQIIKVEAAYASRGPPIPDEIFDDLKLKEFKERCREEVALLKRKRLPESVFSLYDVLIGNLSFVSRLFRDESIAKTLNEDTLYADFPIYGGALKSRVSRGSWRRQVLNDGMKICCALFPQFVTLPWSVRESIVNLLTNQEILVVEACFSRKQLKAIVGIPNCQILLDRL